ncbi:MAG: lysophospholipid acyltransferase family protein [Verrucomicrobiota bacterium]|jgi:hypothetical protein|nr:lysophospholipid acyltransferase family protein [Verrucomicrobiota bacterium]
MSTDTSVAQSSRKSGVITPRSIHWYDRLAAAAVFVATRVLGSTLRIHIEDQSHLFEGPNPQPVIFTLWHNRLALSMPLNRGYFLKRQPQRRLAALVSASRDGSLLARALEHFGVQPVRGSSSRRGTQAMLELATWAENGYDVAITPDGPRGPRYRFQKGSIMLAQITGHPLVPVSAHIRWKKCFKSWDMFQLPMPFTRCDVRIGEPLLVPRNAGSEEREAARCILEQRMHDLTTD